MKNILSIAAAFAVSIAYTQAEDPKPADAKPAEKPAATDKAEKPAAPAKGGDAFAKKDTNNDGFISKEEFVAGAKDAAKAEAAFTKKDKDGDGKLSKEEFAGPVHAGKKK